MIFFPYCIAFFLLLPLPAFAVTALDGLESIGSGQARYLGFIKVYDAELYAEKNSSGSILNADISKCLVLTYSVDLAAEDFVDAANTILQKQHDEQTLAVLSEELDAVHKNYLNVQKGDRYTLCYTAPEEKTTLLLNDREVVSINSAQFAKLYFGIWLGSENTLDASLKKDLLGNRQE